MNQTITKINVAPSRQQNYGAPESTVAPFAQEL